MRMAPSEFPIDVLVQNFAISTCYRMLTLSDLTDDLSRP